MPRWHPNLRLLALLDSECQSVIAGFGGRDEMRARQLLEGATYGPEVLKVLSQAFDEAWAAITPRLGSGSAEQEAVRMRLAHAVLAVAPEQDPTVESVRDAALKVMAMGYPSYLGSLGSGSD